MNDGSLRHLQEMLSRLDVLIQDAVVRAEQAGQDPTDALRGFVVTQEEIYRDLSQEALAASWSGDAKLAATVIAPPASGQFSRFWFLAESYGLDALDAAILLICAAPALDSRYERFYSFLQDNVSQRRPSVSLVMNLLGESIEQRYAVWARLQHHMPLREHQLVVTLPDPNQPNATFLKQILGVDERLIGFMLGDDTPDRRVGHVVRLVEAMPEQRVVADIDLGSVRAALPDAPLIYLQGRGAVGQIEAASILCDEAELPLVYVDAGAITASGMVAEWPVVMREGYLNRAALFIDHWDAAWEDDGQPASDLWRRIVRYPLPVFLSAGQGWEPQDDQRTRPMLRQTFDVPPFTQRVAAWQSGAIAAGAEVRDDGLDVLAARYRFTHSQISHAVRSARDRALSRGELPNQEDLFAGAQAQIALRLGRLAQRIEPRASWNHLVLPDDKIEQLREIVKRTQYNHVVQSDWGFKERLGSLTGVSALFAGESGTGKTLSAQILARELGLALYRIDLSGVVSKYIGETEKNLHTIFEEAQASSAILFFDEADALFGKRSEVKDARDRYANIEIAYLLQKIEEYDGIAIMATNLRQNIDEAFTRRIDFMIDFPFPDVEHRYRIWQVHFPEQAPVEAEVDLHMLAERYRLAGGNIRNAVVAAAYLAAANGGAITLDHIRHAVRREYQKMGRLLEGE